MNSGIPIFKDLAKRIRGNTYYFSADITKAYYQLPASEEYCYSRAFYVPGKGALMFNKRTPLGDASATGVFALAMDVFHSGIDREFDIVNYFDDFAAGTSDLDHLVRLVTAFVARSIETNATFKLSGLRIGDSFTHFAGLRCDEDGVHAPRIQIDKINALDLPNDIASLRSYMGLVNYLDNFLPPEPVLPLRDAVSPYLKKNAVMYLLTCRLTKMPAHGSMFTKRIVIGLSRKSEHRLYTHSFVQWTRRLWRKSCLQ